MDITALCRIIGWEVFITNHKPCTLRTSQSSITTAAISRSLCLSILIPAPLSSQHLQMAHSDSAVARVPIEIWFTILDHVIDVPEYFDATCEGSFLDFWQSHKTSVQLSAHLKKIKKVCRSWERFALERAHRVVDVTVPLRHPLEVVRRAHGADIKGCNYDALECHTRWRRVTIAVETGDQATALTHLAENSSRHPYLRRIYITHKLQNTEYLASLSCFGHITLLWLGSPPTTSSSPHLHKQVTLGRVEVLIWAIMGGGLVPSAFFHLPSLSHLALIGFYSDPLSLAVAFKDTLVSLYISRSYHTNRNQVSGLIGFPKLEEFATDGYIDATNFPSCRTLPTLARIYLDAYLEWNLGEIKKMLASGLRGSFTLRADFSWGTDGRIAHLRDGVTQLDVDDVVKSCEKQGIKFVDSAGNTCPVRRVE